MLCCGFELCRCHGLGRWCVTYTEAKASARSFCMMECKGHGLKDMTPRPSSSQLGDLGQIHPHTPVPSSVGGDLDQQPLLAVGTK